MGGYLKSRCIRDTKGIEGIFARGLNKIDEVLTYEKQKNSKKNYIYNYGIPYGVPFCGAYNCH